MTPFHLYPAVKVLRNNGVLLPPAPHAFLCSVLRNYHDSQCDMDYNRRYY